MELDFHQSSQLVNSRLCENLSQRMKWRVIEPNVDLRPPCRSTNVDAQPHILTSYPGFLGTFSVWVCMHACVRACMFVCVCVFMRVHVCTNRQQISKQTIHTIIC